MNRLVSFFTREFSYLTNQVKWRKWIIGLYTFSVVINLLYDMSSGRVNEITISSWILGLLLGFFIIKMIVTIIFMMNPLLKDAPQEIAYILMLNIISKLFTRVSIYGIATVTLIYLMYQANLFFLQSIFYIMIMYTFFVDLTLKESINVFIQMRLFAENENN